MAIQLSVPQFPDLDVRFQLTVTQCEPVFIFYNNTHSTPFGSLELFTSYDLRTFLLLIGFIPPGAGYFEWICNIPAGYGFWVYSFVGHPILVQSGSVSSCFHDIITTYRYAQYRTADFRSYTANPPPPLVTSYIFEASSTVTFPTGSLKTITVNPEFAAATSTGTRSLPGISHSTPSPPTPSTPSTPSRKSSTPAIAGGVVGGIILVVIVGDIFIQLRKRPRTRSFDSESPHEVDQQIASSHPTTQPPWASNASANNAAMRPHLDSQARDNHVSMEQSGGPLSLNNASLRDPPPDPQTIKIQHPQTTSQTHISMYGQRPDPPTGSDSLSSNPQITSQMHASMYAQCDLSAVSDSSARRPEALHSADARDQIQSASGPSVGAENTTTSDMASALEAFSRLRPEQRDRFRRAITGAQRPEEGEEDGSGRGELPPYSPT